MSIISVMKTVSAGPGLSVDIVHNVYIRYIRVVSGHFAVLYCTRYDNVMTAYVVDISLSLCVCALSQKIEEEKNEYTMHKHKHIHTKTYAFSIKSYVLILYGGALSM